MKTITLVLALLTTPAFASVSGVGSVAPSPLKISEWNSAAAQEIQSKLGRSFTAAELQLIAQGERVMRKNSQAASASALDFAAPGQDSIMFVCVGLEAALVGHYANHVCKEWSGNQTASLRGVDWAGVALGLAASVVIINGPGAHDPANYRGTYVLPVGLGAAWYGGGSAIQYNAKQRDGIAAASQKFTQASEIDESYSLYILSGIAGFMASITFTGTIIVN